MDYRQTLLVLLAVLLCSSQGLTETPTEATLTPQETSTKIIPKSTPQGNVSDLLKMMNILNRRILEVTKTVIRHDEMNTRIMTRLDEMNSETVKRFEEINSTMMTRLDEMNSESVKRFEEINSTMMARLGEMKGETVKRFEENNSTMFSLFDKLDKKTLKKSEEMDNILMKRLDEMNAETVKHFSETDLLVKSLVLLCSSQRLTETPTEATLVQTTPETSALLQPQEVSTKRKEKQFVLFTNEKKTWQGAYDDCIKRNMMLASIESEEENNKVRTLFKNSDRGHWFWLSGTDLDHTGRYVWKSTGREVTYNQWGQGQPDHYVHSDGEVQHCMFVRRDTMLWYDGWCSDLTHYICQHCV